MPNPQHWTSGRRQFLEKVGRQNRVRFTRKNHHKRRLRELGGRRFRKGGGFDSSVHAAQLELETLQFVSQPIGGAWRAINDEGAQLRRRLGGAQSTTHEQQEKAINKIAAEA